MDGETIKVAFGDKNYTIYSHDGSSYRPAPAFSHAEEIRVNQTFVALCNNRPDERDDARNSTGLVIYQYRGMDTHKIAEVRQVLPATEHGGGGATGLQPQGDGVHVVRTITLSPPKEVPVYKFLSMSAHTDGRMRCDYPRVIEHTVDSMRVDPDFRATLREWAEARHADLEQADPARTMASHDALYEWYR